MVVRRLPNSLSEERWRVSILGSESSESVAISELCSVASSSKPISCVGV